jgi:hypothetical protein
MKPFTPEQDQYLQLAQTRAFYQGMREAVRNYAWWRDGQQYVGSVNTTLKQALDDIDQMESEIVERFRRLEHV